MKTRTHCDNKNRRRKNRKNGFKGINSIKFKKINVNNL